MLSSEILLSQNFVNQDRKLTHPIELNEISENGKKIIKSISKGTRFSVLEEVGDDYYKIYFWSYPIHSQEYYSLNKNINTDSAEITQRYFKIKKSDLETYSSEIYAHFDPVYGILTFPFKWRFDTKKVEPTFSLNIAGGVKWRPWRTNRHVVSFLVGIGPSTVKLDKYNSDIANTSQNEDSMDEDIESLTTAAVTFSGNLVYQFDFVQFGLSVGFDRIFENEKFNWKSQGKPWFSLGVGLNIFTNKKDSKATSKEN